MKVHGRSAALNRARRPKQWWWTGVGRRRQAFGWPSLDCLQPRARSAGRAGTGPMSRCAVIPIVIVHLLVIGGQSVVTLIRYNRCSDSHHRPAVPASLKRNKRTGLDQLACLVKEAWRETLWGKTSYSTWCDYACRCLFSCWQSKESFLAAMLMWRS